LAAAHSRSTPISSDNTRSSKSHFVGEISMAKFMLIAGGADLDKRVSNSQLAPVLLERYMAWLAGLKERGQYVSSGKLHDQTGRRLTVRGGEVVDGPFIESKDAVGGYLVYEAASLDAATDVARACPMLGMQNGYVEVRLIEETR
jgi:hypothetical protein